MMVPRVTVTELFDVFRNEPGSLRWIGAAPSMQKALERARKDMGEHGRCNYLILEIKNGKRTVVTPEQLDPGRHR